jgi:hypothetical protein
MHLSKLPKQCSEKNAGLQRVSLPPANWFAPPDGNRSRLLLGNDFPAGSRGGTSSFERVLSENACSRKLTGATHRPKGNANLQTVSPWGQPRGEHLLQNRARFIVAHDNIAATVVRMVNTLLLLPYHQNVCNRVGGDLSKNGV